MKLLLTRQHQTEAESCTHCPVQLDLKYKCQIHCFNLHFSGVFVAGIGTFDLLLSEQLVFLTVPACVALAPFCLHC